MKKLLKNIGDFISKLFKNILPSAQKAIKIGIDITEAIKTFDTNSPFAADILTQIIPGDLDDKIKDKIREQLPKIMVELKLVDATIGLKDPNEILVAATKVIQQLEGDYSSAFLHSLSALITKVASDGKLTWSDSVYLAEFLYQNKKAA